MNEFVNICEKDKILKKLIKTDITSGASSNSKPRLKQDWSLVENPELTCHIGDLKHSNFGVAFVNSFGGLVKIELLVLHPNIKPIVIKLPVKVGDL